MALSSACGGARIGAAMANSRLMVYEAQSGVDYALTADVPLPSEPTDVASLPQPAPAFAVGCTGRSVSVTIPCMFICAFSVLMNKGRAGQAAHRHASFSSSAWQAFLAVSAKGTVSKE